MSKNAKHRDIKHKDLLTIFFVFGMLLIITVFVMNRLDVHGNYLSLDIVAIVITYSGVFATSMFSLYIYRQGKIQSGISDTLKDLQLNKYISENYAILNFTREFSMFSELDVPSDPIIKKMEYVSSKKEIDNTGILTRMVMLIRTDGKPISKVILESVTFNKEQGEDVEFYLPDHEYDLKYTEKVKGRDYELIQMDLMTFGYNIIDLIRTEKIDKMTIRASIFSIFNVKLTVDYYVKLMPEDQLSFNEDSPDKKEIPDLYTRKLFYSRHRIVDKEVLSNDECRYSESLTQ